MKVVITGGAGFIGSNLARKLAADDHQVAVVDDCSTGLASNLDAIAGSVELRVGSILDRSLLDEVFTDADAIVHLAALPSVPRSIEFPVETTNVNIIGTLNVLEACRASGRNPMVVHASSSSVYGAAPRMSRVETVRCEPMSPYAASKLASEAYVLAYQTSYGLPAISFRFFNVYGPYQRPDHAYAPVVPNFVRAAQRGEPFVIHGDGEQTRDFTFVESVASTLAIAATQRRSHGTAVNLAFGTRTTINELAFQVAAEMGVAATLDHRPPRVGDVRNSSADSEVFRSLFPEVRAVALGEGLSQCINWLEHTRS